jgi:hypothetical protein
MPPCSSHEVREGVTGAAGKSLILAQRDGGNYLGGSPSFRPASNDRPRPGVQEVCGLQDAATVVCLEVRRYTRLVTCASSPLGHRPLWSSPSDPNALVFPSRKGGFLPLGEYRWAFDNACDEVGIEGLVPHGLRHTTASLAISAGANVKVVQRLLGHATAAMTLDRDGHLLNGDLTGVADALGEAIDSVAVSLRYSGPRNEAETG